MKHKSLIYAVWAFLLLLAPCKLYCQGNNSTADGTTIEKSVEIGIGGTNRLDTYLSPQDYHGTGVLFASDVLRSRPNKWDLQFTHLGSIDYTRNNAENTHTLAGHYDFTFAMMHRWNNLADGNLRIRLGGMTNLYLGFAYNMRNSSNNPAQAYASLDIGGAGIADYDLHLWNRTFTIRYEAALPLCDIMFSPAYGQSYYELFAEGNYDSNIVFNSIATPSFRQQLTVYIPTGSATSLSIGYLGDIRQAKPNSLRQHVYCNAFVVGICKKLK